MGLFSKAIALDTGETPAEANHPGLLNRVQSTKHDDVERPEVKKKARKIRKYTIRRSHQSR